ncbi:hypothetical protein LINGRAHAP2_LOCUS22663, partial [Linum grandiflorum]
QIVPKLLRFLLRIPSSNPNCSTDSEIHQKRAKQRNTVQRTRREQNTWNPYNLHPKGAELILKISSKV